MNEQVIIDYIASIERSIVGVRESYSYAKNPDSLNIWPVCIHYVPSFQMPQMGFHNKWDEILTVTSILFVKPRQQMAGKLSYLENEAIPFGQKFRSKWQDHDVINSGLAIAGARKFFLASGNYGVGTGNNLLSYGGVDAIGWIFVYSLATA